MFNKTPFIATLTKGLGGTCTKKERHCTHCIQTCQQKSQRPFVNWLNKKDRLNWRPFSALLRDKLLDDFGYNTSTNCAATF
ncbi:hypothetical protein, partial [Vibrio hepatarius]|uniref:hypothetical protein n=1 Tax=Vibrio hepatarius TaxID=171383 RepID=UPI002FD8CFEF